MRTISGPAPGLLAWSLGTFLQLFQPALWSRGQYSAIGLICACMWCCCHRLSGRTKTWAVVTVCFRMVCVAGLAFALTGGRAAYFQQASLSPVLEGIDLWVTGVVAEMPQTRVDGVRFTFDVEHAERQDDKSAVVLPHALSLGWYTSGFDDEVKALPVLRAGQRWRLPVRLKRPHGLVNPGGFDTELWLWSQGVQASGQVRQTRQPQPLGESWHHLVEQWRQSARESIYLSLIHI